MNKLCVVGALLLSSVAVAEKAAPVDKGAAELKALHEKLNKAWETNDQATIKSSISDQMWGSWDMDEAGRPNSQSSLAEVLKMSDDMTKMMKAMGATMKMESKKLDCKASGDMGVCLHEGDFTMTMPKMPPVTMSFRETNVFKKEKGAWKAVHHHGSLAKAPDMPAKSMAMTAKTAQYMDAPNRPGMKMAPIWMNPVTQQMVGVMKTTVEVKQAKHFHPYAAAFYVIEGTMTTTGPDGKDTAYGPGSIFYRAPKEVHATTLKPNTTVFAVTDGPLVEVFVDDKGQPLPQTAQK